jgi:hypothetical protein
MPIAERGNVVRDFMTCVGHILIFSATVTTTAGASGVPCGQLFSSHCSEIGEQRRRLDGDSGGHAWTMSP